MGFFFAFSSGWLEQAEKFQAVLTMSLDIPIEERSLFSKVKLGVTAGMYKLHVDRDVRILFF